MSYEGQIVVDSDAHIREYWDLDRTYKEYMDPQYREKYENFSAAVRANQKGPGEVGLSIFWPKPALRPLGVSDAFEIGETRPTRGNGAARNRTIVWSGREIDPACNWDASIRLRDMDEADIDVSVMFPSQQDGFCMLRDVGFESALHLAYHRYMSALCSESDGRLRWLANCTMRDIPQTMEQLQYWAERDENFVGMFLPRAFPDGRLLDSPDLHPLYQLSEDLDMPLWVHGDPERPPLTPGTHSLDNAAFSRPVIKGWGGMTAMGAQIGGGVFDLYPKLRIGFFENGGGWMPWFIEKLDESYRPGSATTPNLQRKPSEIVAGGQIFCAIDTFEGELGHCVDVLGEHVWLFSTDYPHPGTPWPDGVPQVAARTDMSRNAKIKMLGANAATFSPRLARVGAST